MGQLGANQAVSVFQCVSVPTCNALLVSSWGLAACFNVK